jgi:hypothetical protein
MIETPDVIDALVADTRPVRRLRPPAMRAALWLVLPALVFGLLALAHGARPDLAQRIQAPGFALGVAAPLLTGILAALASFMLNLPDRARVWALLPLPTLVLWLATVGVGCLTNWVEVEPGGLQLGESARCFATVLITSLPLSLGMFVMLRHGSTLRPNAITLTGSLSVAAMSVTAMMLFHRLDASVMVLVWNLGIAALIVALGSSVGRRLFPAA